ncbi:MAG: hypothetical protein NXY57DRAFT_1039346 [Lentinula lateritia]|nr:MAG: hypothetical protein NXY57DRAFT_1039346 [Lentinula lateritia]
MVATTDTDVLRMVEYESLISYFVVSSAALLVYDYCLTLDLECHLVWSKPHRWTNILYLVQRYLPLLDTAILLTVATFLSDRINQKYCDAILNSSLWLHFVGTAFSEVLLSMRIYAISRQRVRHLGYIMSACFTLILVANLVVASVLHTKEQIPPPLRGCLHTDNRIDFTVFIGTYVLYDCGGFVLIIIPAIVEYKDRKFLPLYDSVYRDGKDVTCAPIQIETEHLQAYISTFFCLLSILRAFQKPCVASILFWRTENHMLRAFHSITTSRIVLRIREAMEIRSVQFSVGGTPEVEISHHGTSTTIVFERNID